jgi:hypothetical protein
MATRPTVKRPTLKVPTVKLPNVTVPNVKFPTVKLPTVKLPTFTAPKVTMPTAPVVDERILAAVRDAAYVTVGLGVIAVQQTEARRKELVHAIAERFDANRVQVEELLSTVETQLRKVEAQVRELIAKAA